MPSDDGSPVDGVHRRTVLRRVGVGAATLAGVTGAATHAGASRGAVAGSADSGAAPAARSSPDEFPRVTTRGHFEIDCWHGDRLADGHAPTGYETVGEVPGWTAAGETPEAVVVPVHGWLTTEAAAPVYFSTVATSLARTGYDHPVVGFSYDADTAPGQWWAATDVAERNGAKLAAFLRDFAERNPGTTLRLTGHSLGARVVLSAIASLDDAGRRDVVASASLLGGAADDHAVSTDGQYGGAIERAAGRLDNFWMAGDRVLSWAYTVAEYDAAVGQAGCAGPQPANYTDHDVSYVPDHGSYHEPGEGCVPAVVATF